MQTISFKIIIYIVHYKAKIETAILLYYFYQKYYFRIYRNNFNNNITIYIRKYNTNNSSSKLSPYIPEKSRLQFYFFVFFDLS